MNTIILAAGTGNRLRPITENIPKCLVEIGGKSLLNWQIEALTKAGISKINIVTGHRYHKIINLEELIICDESDIEIFNVSPVTQFPSQSTPVAVTELNAI